MTRHIASLIVICAAFVFVPLDCSAAPITVPTGLDPGDQYRLAFVTSTTRDATSSDIADYNAFVTAVATGVTELAALGTTWTAIGSTLAVDASNNTGTNPTSTGVPIYRLDDTRIANDNADLWDGSILSPLSTREDGSDGANGDLVWTGTDIAFGGGPLVEVPLGSTTGFSRVGDVGTSNPFWIHFTTKLTTEFHHMYAMSGELTVVPEPSTMFLVCIGATIGAGWRIRRRRITRTAAFVPASSRRRTRLVIVTFATVATATTSMFVGVRSVPAAFVVKPVAATSPNPGLGGTSSPVVTIDGSGLAFDVVSNDPIPLTYPTHTSDFHGGPPPFPPGSIWEAVDFPPGQVTYDLGAEYDLTGFHLWNGNQAGVVSQLISVKDIDVSFSTTSATSGFGAAASFSLTAGPGVSTYVGEDYSFGATKTARWVRLDVISNYGFSGRFQLSEIRFVGVPEPSTIALAAFGFVALAVWGWRRRIR